jgi:hypothetical protein
MYDIRYISYMMICHHKNAGHNHHVKIANRWFENLAQFRYLGMKATNQNLIQEVIKRKFNSGNAFHRSDQNLSPSRLSPKNRNIRV